MKAALLIIYLGATTIGFASSQQDSLRPKFGVELTSSASLSSIGIIPTFTYSFGNKSKIALGIGTAIWNFWGFSSGFELSGIEFQFNYKYFLHGETNKVNFYFQGIMKQTAFPYESPNGFKDINHTNEILLGYGMEVSIGRKMYLLNDFAIGELITFETYSGGADFGEIFPNIYIKFGLGYRF